MSFSKLHKESIVIDSHCDTPLRAVSGIDLGVRANDGHFDFPRMKDGGLDAVFFAIYTSNKLSPNESTKRALDLIALSNDNIEANKDKVAFATTAKEIRENKIKGLSTILFGMENGDPIQDSLSLLRLFYKLGIRYMTLTHAGNNLICDSCATKEKKWGGLSPFGIEVVKEMNKLGMIIDVSHISDDSFYDVLKYSTQPIVATHSCCRALADLPRNMTDDMIKALAANDGVIQINFYPAFLSKEYADPFWPLCDNFDDALAEARAKPEDKDAKVKLALAEKEMFALPRPSYKILVDHIDHVAKLVGVKHIGLGSDFDGIEVCPEGLEDVSKLAIITQELKLREYTDEDIKDILGENFLRIMEKICV